ncbi:MAG TPA: phage portal protein [Ktedonobacterales bacterium]
MSNASENAGENAGENRGGAAGSIAGGEARPARKSRRAATTRRTSARHDGPATQESPRAAAPTRWSGVALANEPFSPGQPIRPTPGLSGGEGGPRQWAFPVGYNIAQFPRSTESTSFEQLRSLAALYDGAQLCERAYFDVLGRLELRALPRAELLAEDERPTAPRWREATRRIEAFLESPDRTQDLRAWLVAFVRDLLEIDAVVIYARRTRGGDLYALELVNGETIKPLLDGAGRPPLAPAPAYQQFLYGAPAGWYTRDELDYIRETARTDSPYGVSRIERIILRVNQALRKQSFDLARFTDGATPLGVIQPPDNLTWTPEQLETFERAFNGLLAGADRMRVRARALPPGATWRALSGDDPLVEFDRFLLNVTVAAFGLTMDELGFTSDSNRSVGQSQENVVYRRAVAPVVTLVAAYLTRKVRRWLDDRFTISFGGFEEPEDFAVRAEAFAKLIPLGVVSAQYVARQLHLPYPARS